MWPIPLSVIVWSRLIYSLISYVAGTLALFAAMTAVGWNGYVSQWGLPLYGFFLLFWFGYGLTLCGLFTCLEFGIRFKTYTVISFILVFTLFGGLITWHDLDWNQERAIGGIISFFPPETSIKSSILNCPARSMELFCCRRSAPSPW